MWSSPNWAARLTLLFERIAHLDLEQKSASFLPTTAVQSTPYFLMNEGFREYIVKWITKVVCIMSYIYSNRTSQRLWFCFVRWKRNWKKWEKIINRKFSKSYLYSLLQYEKILTQIQRHVYKDMPCYIWEIILLKHQTRKQFIEFWKNQPHFYTFSSCFIINIIPTHLLI